MNNNQEDRPVCLITGGSSGIGLAAARKFAENGFDLLIAARDPEKLERAKQQIEEFEVHCECVSIDLSADPARAGELADRAMGKFGRIDVLVNNAAFAALAPFDELSAEQFETTINVNHRAIFYLTQKVWPQMVAQGEGVIVNVSSLAAVDPFPGFSIYGAGKAWVDLLTHALADEGREHGVRVYSIRPGAVETPMLRGLFPDFPADQAVSADDVAAMIWYVSADESLKNSGQAFEVSNQD
jgi:NAD(P)-dependent dehydrogenase (short-subunit alcohol dehydrogenase family)